MATDAQGRRIPRWIGWPLLGIWGYIVLGFVARQATFHPSRYPEGLWDLQERFKAEDVFLTTSDGVKIHGWLIPAAGEAVVTTLYLHGNAGNLTHRIDHIQEITRAGSELLIIDYRGYGKSEGSPSEEGLYLDADAAYDWVKERSDRPVVIHGESLGTAPATELASRREAAALILEAPFPSARAVAQRVLPLLGPLIVSGLDTAERMRRVRCPVLVIHGDRDRVIDYELGVEVFEAAAEPKEMWTVRGAGHNNIVGVAGEAYWKKLAELYNRLVKR